MEIVCLFNFVGISIHSQATTFKNNVQLEMVDPREDWRLL